MIWVYNFDKLRFEFDHKLYVNGDSLYWINTDKYSRELDKWDKEDIKKCKERLGL